MLTKILTSVLGALLLAAIFGVLKSRWLYVIAPKLYLNTPISDGQIVSLTIFNAGLLSEEDVAITWRAGCKFELIATSKSTLSVSGKTILIPKLSKREAVNVLLLIEGKAFEHADIESVESKGTAGKIVDSKDKAGAAWQHIIALPLILLVFAVPFVFGTWIGAEMHQSAFGYIADQYELLGPSKQLAGYKDTVRTNYGLGKLEKALKDSMIEITVPEVIRRGDIVTLMVKLKNNAPFPIMAEGSVKGTAGNGSLSYSDMRVETFSLASGDSKMVKLQVFLPESVSAKMVEGTYRFESLDAGHLAVTQILQFD